MQYECDGFLDKNRDTVFEELINILKASQVLNFIRLYNFYVTRGWPDLCNCVCPSVCQSELVAELFQQQGNVPSVANGSVRSGKRATREHKLTVGFQVSWWSLCFVDWVENSSLTLYGLHSLFLCWCLSVPSVLTDAHGHSQQHHSSLRPLH